MSGETMATNEHLKLRKTKLGEFDHPDERPCPPWCWVVLHNPTGLEHEIEADRITAKMHSLEAEILVRASMFNASNEEGRVKTTATYEPHLQQRAGGQPFITVGLRHHKWIQGEGMVPQWRPDVLKLTIEDTRDMITALQYLVDVATGDTEPIVEHEDCACPTS